jgi:hypothetical protein
MSRVTSVPVWVGTFVYAYAANALSRPSVKGVLRCLAGLIVASATYVLVLLPVVLFIAPEAGRAAITYACGIALATMLGTWACSLVVLPGHRTIGMLLCIGLGMAFPVIVAALSEPTAPVRSMQYLYLIATALGGITALMAWSHRATPAAPSLGRP